MNKPRDWKEMETSLEIENQMLRAQLVGIEWVKFGRQWGQGATINKPVVSSPTPSPELAALYARARLDPWSIPFDRIPDYCNKNGFPIK